MKPAFMSLIALAIAGVGCGDGGGPVDTGLQRSKPVNTLTDNEARQACESIADENFEFSLSRRQECTLGALFFTETEAECIRIRDTCLEMEPEPQPPPEPTDCTEASAADLGMCTATVGEVEDCLNDQFSSTQSFYNSLTCADAGSGLEPPTVLSCQEVERTCPELFDESSPG